MNRRQKAVETIQRAEAGLLELMRQATDAQAYREVAELAEMAYAVAEVLRRAERGTTGLAAKEAEQSAAVAKTAVRRAPRGGGHIREYPRFRRDLDKLVKIGWSKKDRREYEHRAPRAAVMRVAEHLQSVAPAGQTFAMDRVLPVKDDKGKELPSYQVYLALAWFRALGAVEERGKEGYAVVGGRIASVSLESEWEQLAEGTG